MSKKYYVYVNPENTTSVVVVLNEDGTIDIVKSDQTTSDFSELVDLFKEDNV